MMIMLQFMLAVCLLYDIKFNINYLLSKLPIIVIINVSWNSNDTIKILKIFKINSKQKP